MTKMWRFFSDRYLFEEKHEKWPQFQNYYLPYTGTGPLFQTCKTIKYSQAYILVGKAGTKMRLALLRLRQKVNFRLVRLLLIGMDASIFHTGILYTIIIYKNLTKSSLIKNNLFIYIPCLIQHFDYPITDYSTVRTQWVFTFVIYSRRVVPVKRNQL